MARYIGQCSNCGSAKHPKGNVFRIMSGAFYDIDFPHMPEAPTEIVKVCNNCNTAHPFKRRVSAKKKKLQATMDWLLSQEN